MKHSVRGRGFTTRRFKIIAVVMVIALIGAAVYLAAIRPWENKTQSNNGAAAERSYTERHIVHEGEITERNTRTKTITLNEKDSGELRQYTWNDQTGFYKGMSYDEVTLDSIANGTYVYVEFDTDTLVVDHIWVK